MAQPDWSPFACMMAAAFGYALFWKGLLYFKLAKIRFLISLIWFGVIQSFHLNWLRSDRYVGGYIYIFFFLLLLGLAIQFAFICLFIRKNLSFYKILGISGGWVLCEWSRLFIFSGYSWNPIGIALSGNLYGMQFASIFGIFGMSFWVFFTNLLALQILNLFLWHRCILWLIMVGTPYLFGWLNVTFHKQSLEKDSHVLSTLLVQTAIYPEYKISLNGSIPIPPEKQWERILTMLSFYTNTQPDLIVLSEGVVPYGAHFPIYSVEDVKDRMNIFFHQKQVYPTSLSSYVGNVYWAQAIANIFSADVIIGLEDFDIHEEKVKQAYNAAFLVHPFSEKLERYEKRILVPMGEYIPFQWCRAFLQKYGIKDSFCPGKEAKIFETNHAPIGVSICYEETYGNLMRANRLKGAQLLVNLTNDVWYPHSRLPIIHFLHGRLRAIEAGVPLLRCCNTGVTCGLDSLGRLVGILEYESPKKYASAEVLMLSLPLYTYSTLYTQVGDLPLIIFCSVFFVWICASALRTRKSFFINDIEVLPLHKN
ncbi:MAG: apolipoprotein N-acyltransferase [Chlamydiales bacterium]